MRKKEHTIRKTDIIIRKIQNILPALLLSAVLLGGGAVARAQEPPELDQTGSISGTMLYEGNAVGGGSLTLYLAGVVSWSEEEGYQFVLTDDFAGSEASLEDPEDAFLAGLLAEYAYGHGLTGTSISIGEDGAWIADGLPCGLYLVVQDQAADGYQSISPFLVSIPVYDEASGTWIYAVDAQPKMETVTAAESPETKEETIQEKDPQVSAGKLPQTGQLNWPVPALALTGLILFSIGRRLNRKDREGQTCEA